MRYYLVYAADMGYQKTEGLTYSSKTKLATGNLVLVPYGRKTVAGIVKAETSKPPFETKPISELLDPVPLPAISLDLFEWMQSYYPDGTGALAATFVPTGLQVKPRATKVKETKPKKLEALPELTKEQAKALAEIAASSKKTFLLHGETGSGKTRIYLEAALETVKTGKSVLVLTPEISLVPQLADSFKGQFGDQVTVIHSGLTRANRNKNWLKILHADQPMVIIGTRSALFTPIKNLGLVVVDEMHEPAYKQDSTPHYQALRVAGTLARLHGAKIIYGSATPPVVEYYIAKETDTPILRLTETALPIGKVKRQLIDLKKVESFSRHRYLSDELIKAITKRLSDREQSLIFLNRRGTARQVLCEHCGWQALCPRCDVPLIYHADSHNLRCHSCGYRANPPYNCPDCGADEIKYRSLGTKALVDDLLRIFPEAIIKRFDTDNLTHEKLDQHFGDVRAGKIDILVGTQMLGKGLDLPRLSLVGIVNADTGLGMPDFSAAERSYQLLHQAIGRVGRGHLHGEVIVQSFNPDSPLLHSALKQDWQSMYEREIAERRQFKFPPFSFLLKITVSRKTSQTAEQYADKLYRQIADMKLKVGISEPVPSFYERTRDKYNWQLVVRSKSRDQLTKIVTGLPKGDYTFDLDPINLL